MERFLVAIALTQFGTTTLVGQSVEGRWTTDNEQTGSALSVIEIVAGEILDPASGQVYSSKLWLEDPNTLHVRGCAGPLDLFYRTQTMSMPHPFGLLTQAP